MTLKERRTSLHDPAASRRYVDLSVTAGRPERLILLMFTGLEGLLGGGDVQRYERVSTLMTVFVFGTRTLISPDEAPGSSTSDASSLPLKHTATFGICVSK